MNLAPTLKYGLLAAGGMATWLLLEYLLGLHGPRIAWGLYTNWGTELILIVALWRLLHHQLHAANRYWLPVWEGLVHGLLASLVAAMGLYVFLFAYLYYINPDFPDVYLQWKVDRMRAASVPEDEIREIARSFRWTMGPSGLPLSVGGLCLLIGLVASPVIALWLNWRRKESADVD